MNSVGVWVLEKEYGGMIVKYLFIKRPYAADLISIYRIWDDDPLVHEMDVCVVEARDSWHELLENDFLPVDTSEAIWGFVEKIVVGEKMEIGKMK